MGNCKSDTIMGHEIVDLKNQEQVVESLMGILACDNDLTENEDYFSDDTLELGYESEAERIVQEYIKKHGVPKTVKAYQKAFDKVMGHIEDQDYFGTCQSDIIDIGNNRVSVSYVIGGNDDF